MQQEVTSCVMMRHKPLLKVRWGLQSVSEVIIELNPSTPCWHTWGVNGGGSVGTDVFAGPCSS